MPPSSPVSRAFLVAALAAGLASFAVTSVRAQAALDETPAAGRTDAPGSDLALGLGFASRQRVYTGVKRDNKAIPLVFWDTRWVKVAGTGLEVKLGRADLSADQQLSGGLRLAYQRDGYDAGDSPALAGMEDRKASFWGGVGGTWSNPFAQVSAEWLADLSGHSRGQKLQAEVEHRFGLGRFALTPRLQAQWADSQVVDYYFGVRDAEALPNRPAYSPGAATSVGAGLRVDWLAGAHHALFLDVGATHVAGGISRSPIVDRSDSSQIALGYLYRF